MLMAEKRTLHRRKPGIEGRPCRGSRSLPCVHLQRRRLTQ